MNEKYSGIQNFKDQEETDKQYFLVSHDPVFLVYFLNTYVVLRAL